MKNNSIYYRLVIGLLTAGSLFAQTDNKTDSNHVFFRIAVNLPGKTNLSHAEGTYFVKSGNKLITRGKFNLKDLSTNEKRTFQIMIADADTIDWQNQGLEWSFKGEIYDSKLKETFPVFSMNMTAFSAAAGGIGFEVKINDQKHVTINNRIYKNN